MSRAGIRYQRPSNFVMNSDWSPLSPSGESRHRYSRCIRSSERSVSRCCATFTFSITVNNLNRGRPPSAPTQLVCFRLSQSVSDCVSIRMADAPTTHSANSAETLGLHGRSSGTRIGSRHEGKGGHFEDSFTKRRWAGGAMANFVFFV